MATSPGPSRADAVKLTAYLQEFEKKDFRAVKPSPPESPGVIAISPSYSELFAELTRAVGKSPWFSPEYNRRRAMGLIDQPEQIAEASTFELSSILTFLSRAERFSAGAWGDAFEKGTVIAVLRRMRELMPSME